MKEKQLQAGVRWADGTYDHARTCIECGLDTCKYPVHAERYKTISSAKARTFDAQSGIEELNKD